MSDTLETTQQPETLNRAIADLGLTVDCVFVPAAKDTADKELRLNWRATIKHNGRPVLETPYTQGVGHCPAYKDKGLGMRDFVVRWDAIRNECVTGRTSCDAAGIAFKAKPIPAPAAADILYSLASDADAIDYATYEDWAQGLGYDPDSREGERIYRACLEIALKLRAALGEDGLVKLREATQDY